MPNKRLLIASIASFSLLGCAGMHEQLSTGCAPGICKVEVRVADCRVSVSPDRLVVPLPRIAKNIEWSIATDDYVFATNGIVIEDPKGEFEQPNLSAHGKKFKWHNKHSVKRDYKYTVNVIKTGKDPKSCSPHDPVISNS